jgi:hypothetical protein
MSDDVRLFMSGSHEYAQLECMTTAPVKILGFDVSEHTVVALLESGVSQYIGLPVDVERLCRKMLM